MHTSPLGKKSRYSPFYDPGILFPVPRRPKREELNIYYEDNLPFFGHDRWAHYEVSWLNSKGKPMVAMAALVFPCTSPYLIESKSMKLYFNSLNNTKFPKVDTVLQTIAVDLTTCAHDRVEVALVPLSKEEAPPVFRRPSGKCIDELDIECDVYVLTPSFLMTEEQHVTDEVLFSDLFKSNCLVTHQPDWGSIQVIYTGKKINEAGLLRYIVSFRDHHAFHEQCIERIFMDILRRCRPEKLTVMGHFTRRGGIDINPVRSTGRIEIETSAMRLIRQ